MKEVERKIRETLRRSSVPDEANAEERAWELIRAAHAGRPEPRPSFRKRRHVVQIAVALGLVAALVSPAGAAVRHWVADTVNLGKEPSKPALTSLPARGSLLVQSPTGPWVVRPDGSKRLLGTYSGATWSPRGLYIAATSRHKLVAIDPTGAVRWALERTGPVRLPSWNGPEGFRIAYLDGSALRVVDGDGTGDHMVMARVASVRPAWQPGPRYVLAFARPDGSVEAVRADSGFRVFSTGPRPQPRALEWSSDGRVLLIARPTSLELRDNSGRAVWRWAAALGSQVVTAQLEPQGNRAAVILSSGGRSRLLLVGPNERTRVLFSGPGRFSGLQWSPDRRWLLLAWRSTDQWLFLNPSQPRRIVAISNITSQFAPGKRESKWTGFPQVRGWCCTK